MYVGTKTDERRIKAQNGIWIHITLISVSGTIPFRVTADDVTVRRGVSVAVVERQGQWEITKHGGREVDWRGSINWQKIILKSWILKQVFSVTDLMFNSIQLFLH